MACLQVPGTSCSRRSASLSRRMRAPSLLLAVALALAVTGGDGSTARRSIGRALRRRRAQSAAQRKDIRKNGPSGNSDAGRPRLGAKEHSAIDLTASANQTTADEARDTWYVVSVTSCLGVLDYQAGSYCKSEADRLAAAGVPPKGKLQCRWSVGQHLSPPPPPFPTAAGYPLSLRSGVRCGSHAFGNLGCLT